jgi:hypothetical protein
MSSRVAFSSVTWRFGYAGVFLRQSEVVSVRMANATDSRAVQRAIGRMLARRSGVCSTGRLAQLLALMEACLVGRGMPLPADSLGLSIVAIICRFPIAKGEAGNDIAVNVAFGISGGVPNALNRRIMATCHSIDRVVVPAMLITTAPAPSQRTSPCAILETEVPFKNSDRRTGCQDQHQ